MPDKTILKAGIVGAGLMGRWHANALKKYGGRLRAVVDLDFNAAKRLAASYSNAEPFSDIEQMLVQCELNVLHICTPVSTHKKIAERAIKAGINLIVEKPLTSTASEAELLFDMAKAHSVLICPVHQFIFQDGVQKALQWLPRIGRLVHIKASICSAGGTGQPPERLEAIVKDILPHPLSLIQVFLPHGLSGVDWITSRPGYGELLAIGDASGISLSIFTSMDARPTECSFRITGTEGTIHIDLFHGFAFIESGQVSRARKITHPFAMAIKRFSTAFVNLGQRVIQGNPAYPGLRQLIGSFYRALSCNGSSPISRTDAIAVAGARDLLARSAGID